MKHSTTSKGFKIIDLSVPEVMKLGGIGICDYCGQPSSSFKYIGALNSCYCPECFDGWNARATYYPEDAIFEERKIKIVTEILSI